MFRRSASSTQLDVLSNPEQHLSDRDCRALNDLNAWYNVFYAVVTQRVPEERFRPLFDEATGRPNASIRVLVGMLILKEGFGWSDEQLFEALRFHLLVRRALGLFNLTDEVPSESTYYLFKQRLYQYQVETGISLLHEVFQELTRGQAERFGVVGEKLRMDSTLLDSNLATCTRLQLFISCLQVFWKSLDAPAQARAEAADREWLAQLCGKRPNQVIYRLDEATKKAWLEAFGGLLGRLLRLYSEADSAQYAVLERLLMEQYAIDHESESLSLKSPEEISADSLQSPHDLDAAYRKKGEEKVRGYSANVTETCEQDLNLITDVQVEPATAADNGYLQDAVEHSEQVAGEAKEISADGAYYSEDNAAYAEQEGKRIHYTGFPGKRGRYRYERTEAGVRVTDTETGDTILAEEYKPGRYRFRFTEVDPWRYVKDKDIARSERRQQTEDLPRELYNRRCNVEATIFQLCYHTRKKQLRYRGQFRVTLWAICRAAWINVSRITDYQGAQAKTAPA